MRDPFVRDVQSAASFFRRCHAETQTAAASTLAEPYFIVGDPLGRDRERQQSRKLSRVFRGHLRSFATVIQEIPHSTLLLFGHPPALGTQRDNPRKQSGKQAHSILMPVVLITLAHSAVSVRTFARVSSVDMSDVSEPLASSRSFTSGIRRIFATSA